MLYRIITILLFHRKIRDAFQFFHIYLCFLDGIVVSSFSALFGRILRSPHLCFSQPLLNGERIQIFPLLETHPDLQRRQSQLMLHMPDVHQVLPALSARKCGVYANRRCIARVCGRTHSIRLLFIVVKPSILVDPRDQIQCFGIINIIIPSRGESP